MPKSQFISQKNSGFYEKTAVLSEKSVLFVCVFVQFACVIIKTLSPMSVAPGDFLLSS